MKRHPHLRQKRTGFLTAVVLLLTCSKAAAVDLLPSTSPPGNLAPTCTPQIVLLTFDDSVTTASFALVQQVLTNHFNPNGHSIKATFFVSLGGNYDPVAIRRLYEAGHEIAVHTMSHATDENSTQGRWQQEIAGEKRMLSALCGIPANDIIGFRAPFLMPSDKTFRVLFKRKFLYDSTFRESLSALSTAPTNMIWPYTLDHGLQQDALPAYAPTADYPGLFEIPLWAQFSNTTAVATMDPPEELSPDEVVALWKTNFLARYRCNRTPYGLFLHASTSDQWLSTPTQSTAHIGALRQFIDWALAQPDTWFITCHDLVDFMLAPVSASSAAVSPPFQTQSRTQFPTSGISRCAYPGSHTFNVCGECPPAVPNYTNAYLGFVPRAGGAISLNVLSQDATYAWCAMAVSNDTPERIYNWSVRFALLGGEVQKLYDATWTQTAGQISADARQYNRQIAPGATLMLTFRVLRNGGEVTFGETSLAASGLGPGPIRLTLQHLTTPSRWRLSWDDNAYSYRVECATNLLAPQGWASLTDDLCQPELTDTHAPDDGARFYRVRGTIEDEDEQE